MTENDIAWAFDAALWEAEKRTRRERIATAALQGLCAHYGSRANGVLACWALQEADQLIAELDKPKPSPKHVDPAPCKNPRCFGGRVDDGRCPDCTSPTMPRLDEP